MKVIHAQAGKKRLNLSLIVAALCMLLVLTACGSTGGSSSTSSSSSQGSQQTGNGDNTQQEEKLIPVKIAQDVDGALFLPMYVALHYELFQKHGLDPQFLIVGGGSIPEQSLVAGEVHFTSNAASTEVVAINQGLPIKIIAHMVSGSTMTVVSSPELADKIGVHVDMPLDEKLQKIAAYAKQTPLTWGVTNPSSASYIDAVHFIQEMGLTHGEEIKTVALDNFSNIAAAISKGAIDLGYLFPPMDRQVYEENAAVPLIRQGTEVDLHRLKPNIVIATSVKMMEENPDVVRKFAAAIAEANALAKTLSGEELIKVYEGHVSGSDEDLIHSGQFIQNMIVDGAKFTTEGLEILLEYMKTSKALPEDATLTPDDIATNEFLP